MSARLMRNCAMFFRRLTLLLCIAILPPLAGERARAAPPDSVPTPPPGFAERFDQLSGLLNSDDLSGLEMAQATLLSTAVFGAGTQAMPYVRSRFMAAKTQGDAGLAGVFLVNQGGEQERQLIRSQTETDARKRKWIWNYVASEDRFFGAIQQGAQWQAAASLLPASGRCRQLAELCLDSHDVLTRRAGLFWGYWVADASFWKKVRTVLQSEPDNATKRMAARLLANSAKQK